MPEETVFHKIIKREIPSDIVFEDDDLIVINDINPEAPNHLLVIPKVDIRNITDAKEEHAHLLGKMLLRCAAIAKSQGIDESGYRIVINNNGDAQQTVFQLHMHVLGGRKLQWPPG